MRVFTRWARRLVMLFELPLHERWALLADVLGRLTIGVSMFWLLGGVAFAFLSVPGWLPATWFGLVLIFCVLSFLGSAWAHRRWRVAFDDWVREQEQARTAEFRRRMSQITEDLASRR